MSSGSPSWLAGIGYTVAVTALNAVVTWSWRGSAMRDLELADKLDGTGTEDGARLAHELRARACAKVERGVVRRKALLWVFTKLPMTTVGLGFMALVSAYCAANGKAAPDLLGLAVVLGVSLLNDFLESRLGPEFKAQGSKTKAAAVEGEPDGELPDDVNHALRQEVEDEQEGAEREVSLVDNHSHHPSH